MPNTMRMHDPYLRRARAGRRYRPRVLPTLAALVAVVVCVAAGNWQQRRMHSKEELRAQYEAARAQPPVGLAAVPRNADWSSLRYREVAAIGNYLGDRQVLIDNRVMAGRAGFHVVTPLAMKDGRVVLVDRGWIPQQASRSVLPQAPPPPGEVTVKGRLSIPGAGYLELKPDVASGPVRQNLDPARFAAETGLDVLPAVVEATEAPIPDDGLARAWPAPDFGIDTHRIYMMQWYAFALLAALLWLWFHRPRVLRGPDG